MIEIGLVEPHQDVCTHYYGPGDVNLSCARAYFLRTQLELNYGPG